MVALYNEIDPFAAAWLRELIRQGHIAPGDVAECSIEDLTPNDIRGYTQFHAFAGIGVWSYSLRRAGWPDDRPVWTMSCPCQPFSAAGKGAGFADERHLWPAAHWLIEQCRPDFILGEQVASKDGLAWLDLVQTDLEGAGYANGAVDLCAAGVGAPHIRQRLWWFAESLDDTLGDGRRTGRGNHTAHDRIVLNAAGAAGLLDDDDDARLEGQRRGHQAEIGQRQGSVRPASPAGELGWMADCDGYEPRTGRNGGSEESQGLRFEPGRRSAAGGLADDAGNRRSEQCPDTFRSGGRSGAEKLEQRSWGGELRDGRGPTGPTNGLWRDADWLFCRDGKWRPVEPGTFPLAHGAPARVGRLRGYGNAIVAQAAQAVIEAYLEARAVDLRLTSVSEMTTDNNEQTDIFS